MSKSTQFRPAFALMVALIVLAALVMGFALNLNPGTASAAESGGVFYDEDFSDGVDGTLAEHMVVSNGEATLSSGQMFNLPIGAFPESNNVELSFDIKLNEGASSDVYIHFAGLDGTLNANIFLGILGGGAYWRMSNQGDAFGQALLDVYNNSGDNQGGLDGTPVDLTEYAHVRFIHYEGYLEVWVNGTRRAVSHLSNFGNTNYMQRGEIAEGKITAISVHALKANAVALDNVKVSEATGASVRYKDSSEDTSVTSSKIFPLSAQNLYHENFKVTGTFAVADATKTDYYPTIKLYGLNGGLKTNTGTDGQKEYSVNIQAGVNGSELTPGIFGQVDNEPSSVWKSASGAPVSFEGEDSVTFAVEVYGDNIDFYVNGQLSVSTTFTEMGLTKGRLQYIKIQSGTNQNGGMYWTDFSYSGYGAASGATVSAEETLVLSGSDVTVTADVFGDREQEYAWYVNGEKQSETGTQLVLNDIAAGEYTIEYKSDSVSSNTLVITAVDKLAQITVDKTEGYSTDTFTVQAQLTGDFSDENMTWYVNDAAQSEQSTTLTLEGLSSGLYVIVYRGQTETSNSITVNVMESEVVITSDRLSYFSNETAVFEAQLAGFPEGETLSWYVDGELVAGENGSLLELALDAYQAGDQIVIMCMTSGGAESNEAVVTISYDVLDAIENDENYKVIYTDVIEAGGNYGTFSVGEDEDGPYLYSQLESGSTWYSMAADMPTSNSFVLTYRLWVPADINGKFYVYPTLAGLNSKYPQGMVETAIEVSTEGFRPYFKDQSNGAEYTVAEYGFGKDLSYEGGIARKGGWNEIAVAVQGSYVTMYINGEIAVFFTMPTATVPSAVHFNLFPDGGSGVVPVRIKDMQISGIEMPAPDLESVSLSISSVETEIGGTVNFTANLNPFNAEANVVEWYVNGEKAEGSGLKFAFTADAAGEYEVYCVVDGIKSETRTLTVLGGDADGDGGQLPPWAIALIVIGAAAVVGGAIFGTVVALRKKKA